MKVSHFAYSLPFSQLQLGYGSALDLDLSDHDMDPYQDFVQVASPYTTVPPVQDEPIPLSPRWVAPMALALCVVALVLPILSALALASKGGAVALLTDPDDPSGLSSSSSDTDPDGERIRELEDTSPEVQYAELINRDMDHFDLYSSWQSLQECVFCLDPLKPNDMVRRLPCGHIFHSRCIMTWFLREHHNCPLCMAGFLHRAVL